MKKNIFILLSLLFNTYVVMAMEEGTGKKRKLNEPFSLSNKKQKIGAKNLLFCQISTIGDLIKREDFGALQELIENGDLSLTDNSGNTLLHLIATVKKKSSDIEELIVPDEDLLTKKKQPKNNLNDFSKKNVDYHARGVARCLFAEEISLDAKNKGKKAAKNLFADEELPLEEDFLVAPTKFDNSTDLLCIAQLLINNAPFLLSMRNNCGMTPLHCAAHSGSLELVKLFLDAKDTESNPLVDVEQQVEGSRYKQHYESFTPLHFAALKGHTEIVQLLVDYGAQLDAQVRETQARYHALSTPLMLAASKEHADIIQILLSTIKFPQFHKSEQRSSFTLKRLALQNVLNFIGNQNADVDVVMQNIKLGLKKEYQEMGESIDLNNQSIQTFVIKTLSEQSAQKYLKSRYFAWLQQYCSLKNKEGQTAYDLMKLKLDQLKEKSQRASRRVSLFDQDNIDPVENLATHEPAKRIMHILKCLEEGYVNDIYEFETAAHNTMKYFIKNVRNQHDNSLLNNNGSGEEFLEPSL